MSDHDAERISGIDVRLLIAGSIGALSAANVTLLAFLGNSAWLVATAGVAATGLVAVVAKVALAGNPLRIGYRTLTVALCAALVILILGGEGRLLYANTDWQVRGALLRDMGRMAWPYVYQVGGSDHILRAPIGMYLLPALIGGASQRALDIALLAQNTAIVGCIFAIGATIYTTAKARLAALLVFVMFSGLDIVGTMVAERTIDISGVDHIENWADLQYSSTLTLAFWVPNHAIPGWLCALFYLTWRDGKTSIVPLMCVVPLGIIWSPLAAMGALPFAAIAGIETLLRRKIRLADVAAPALAVTLAVPTLLYLRSGGSTITGGLLGARLAPWTITMLLEVAPFAVPLLFGGFRARFGGVTLTTVTVCLMLMPLYWVGPFPDFQRRAAITASAILAISVADMMIASDAENRWRRIALTVFLAIGSVTGALEIRRAFTLPASPAPRCSFIGAWDNQTSVTGGLRPNDATRDILRDKSTYLTPQSTLDVWLKANRYHRVPVSDDPAQCWTGAWPMSKEFTRTYERMRKSQLAQ